MNNAAKFCATIDAVFDELLGKLGCTDGTDAVIINHWQPSINSARLQVTRKSDGRSLTRSVRTADCSVTP